VVVPGITGSALYRDNRAIWDLSVAAVAQGVAHSAQMLEELRLPEGFGDTEPGPTERLEAVGLIRGWHVWPGFWAGAGYGRLLDHFRGLRPEPGQVIPFAYDWRLSNRVTARRLQKVVETEVAQWREKPGNSDAKVTYVCHSMGGLVARYYLEVLGGRETASQLITIGTPYSGSIKAIKALTDGPIPLLPRLNDQLVDVARTLPGVHQLLPTYHCIDTGVDAVTLSEVGLPDLPSDFARDALDLRAEIADALSRNGAPPYRRYAFGGRRQPTDQSVSNTPRGLRYHRHQRGKDQGGDGTVPLFSSVAPEDETTAAGTFHAVRHSGLQRNRLLLDQVTDKVDEVNLSSTLAPAYELSLDLPEIVIAGTDVPISVTTELPDLLLQARVYYPNGNPLGVEIAIQPEGGGTYTAALQLPPGTWHIEVETVAATPPARVGDVVIACPSDTGLVE
jgi:pimeloyl-ACP methyl ester carboxylesterase